MLHLKVANLFFFESIKQNKQNITQSTYIPYLVSGILLAW